MGVRGKEGERGGKGVCGEKYVGTFARSSVGRSINRNREGGTYGRREGDGSNVITKAK